MNRRPLQHARSVQAGLACVVLCSLLMAGAAAASQTSHLPFFHENRAFVLQAWERSRIASDHVDTQARAWDYDPFADWDPEDAVAQARAAFDSASTPEDLGAFHAALDSLFASLDAAARRLDDLDFRFAAHTRTGLELTLATPRRLDVVRVEADLEGEPVWQHDLTGAERAALQEGGILEVMRRAIEPRLHRITVRTWVRGKDTPSVTQVDFEPTPNELVRVHLTLQKPEEPAAQERTLVTEGS